MFEKLLEAERVSVERFVRFRLNFQADADDVLQEVYLTAYQKFPQLNKKDSFKAWIISIARNKPMCNVRVQEKAYILPTSTGTSEAVKVCGRNNRHQKSKSFFMIKQ